MNTGEKKGGDRLGEGPGKIIRWYGAGKGREEQRAGRHDEACMRMRKGRGRGMMAGVMFLWDALV